MAPLGNKALRVVSRMIVADFCFKWGNSASVLLLGKLGLTALQETVLFSLQAKEGGFAQGVGRVKEIQPGKVDAWTELEKLEGLPHWAEIDRGGGSPWGQRKAVVVVRIVGKGAWQDLWPWVEGGSPLVTPQQGRSWENKYLSLILSSPSISCQSLPQLAELQARGQETL